MIMSVALTAPDPVRNPRAPSTRRGLLKRWLARLRVAREKRANAAALRRLGAYILTARAADRASVGVQTDSLRRSLR
jgi:hypothetical protein